MPMMKSAMLAALALALPMGASASPARFDRFSYEGKTLERVALPAGDYRNPILAGYYPDPSITRVGSDYYLVNSSFAHYPGLPIFHSKDMVNWVQIGNAIDRPGQLDFSHLTTSRAVFAPDISWHDGTFYIVNTCVDCKGNFVITAKNPAGPWSDPIWLPFEGIDPSIYWEGDHAYIVNNRAPNEPPRYSGHRAIWLQEFDWRHGKMVGESTQIINGGVDIAKKPSWIEGPHLFKKDGFYYLTAAEGGTADNHSQVVFRSKDLRGPYLPWDKNPILTQRELSPDRPHPVTSTGHADLIQTQNGDWWATFLGIRPYAPDKSIIGRETFLLPVTWHDGWPTILESGKPVPLVAKKPALPAGPKPALPTSGDFSYVDEFNGSRLSLPWIGIRTPQKPFYHLKSGALELDATVPLGDTSTAPAFIGRRLQHAVATISTTLHFQPDRDGARAGLAAVQSDRSWLFLGVTRIGGKKVIALTTHDKSDAETVVASVPLTSDLPVTLSLHVNGAHITGDYTLGGQRHHLNADVDADLLTTSRAGGFVGTVVGLYHAEPR